MRLINRPLAAVLALLLAVVAALLVIEVVADRLNHKPAIVQWRSAYRWAGRTTWVQGSVRVTCIVLVVVGLVLLVVELRRPKVQRLPVAADDTAGAAIDTAYTRRGVAAAVRSAVTAVDGVRSADVAVTRRAVKVRATTSARDAAAAQQLQPAAQQAAGTRLDELHLAHPLRLTLTAVARKS